MIRVDTDGDITLDELGNDHTEIEYSDCNGNPTQFKINSGGRFDSVEREGFVAIGAFSQAPLSQEAIDHFEDQISELDIDHKGSLKVECEPFVLSPNYMSSFVGVYVTQSDEITVDDLDSWGVFGIISETLDVE